MSTFIQLFMLVPGFVFIAWMIFAIMSIAKGAPFVRSKNSVVESMIRLSNVHAGEKSVDLGAGNGKIPFAFARVGAEAHGYEINGLLVVWSRIMARVYGLHDKVFLHWGNLWQTDFSQFDVVTVYGIPFIMKDLEKKLLHELKPGSRIVSNTFQFPTLASVQQEGTVYLYVVPDTHSS